MKWFRTIGVASCAALVLASIAAAQDPVRRLPGTDDKVGVAIALQVGGEAYQLAGQGNCTHEPKGYIYEVPAHLWMVEHSQGPRHVMLTFWRPASGSGDMFKLYVQGAGKTYAADTIKTRTGGNPRGSGEVVFAAAGKGGTFSIKATAANGAKISGTIRCDAFTAAIAEGGN